MHASLTIFLINDTCRAIQGVYEPDGKTQVFKTLDQSIKKDDYVVVPTGTRHGMTVFKVTEVDVDVDLDSSTEMKWVVQKVDTVSHQLVLDQEADILAKVKRAEMRKRRATLANDILADVKADVLSSPLATASLAKRADLE